MVTKARYGTLTEGDHYWSGGSIVSVINTPLLAEVAFLHATAAHRSRRAPLRAAALSTRT